jgi:hypothetical protein
MFVSAACRGCGRPVRLPDGATPTSARCPGCRGRAAAREPVLSLDDEPETDSPGSCPGLAKTGPAKPGLINTRLARAEPPPLWLVAVGCGFALALWVGPVAVSRAAGINLGLGMLVGGLMAAAALAANAWIAFGSRIPVGAKVGLMAGVAAAVLGTFFVGAHLAGWDTPEEQVAAPPPSPPPPSPPPPQGPPEPPPPQIVQPRRPPSHVDLAYHYGTSRLDDGPAAVTALALAPLDGAAVIGYADGTTLVWPLDQPTFENPHPGPKGDGAVRRIQFDTTGQLAYLTCDNGLVVAPLLMPPAVPLKITGERIVVLADPTRDRFAAVRGGKLCIRYVPTDLAKKPPAVKAPERFALCPPKQEVLPAGLRPEYPLTEPNPTFVAWHPAGRLLWGSADGAVYAWPGAGPKPEPVTKEHKGAVRAWTVNGADFATGDESGGFGYWAKRATTPVMYWNGTAPITHLAFASWGLDLVVADAAGGLSVWDLARGKRAFEVRRPAPVAAVSFGPSDDLVLIADGKGVEVWWTRELAKGLPPKATPPKPKLPVEG